MNDYYQEFLVELNSYIEKKQYQEALFLINKELQMPYIPNDNEPILKEKKKDLIYLLNNQKETQEDSLDTLLNKLKSGKPQLQLMAAEKLCERNLRVCCNDLQDYFSKDPLPEAMMLLIDALAQQEINEEFTIKKNGVEYTFWPDAITPVAKSKGFQLASQELNSIYQKEPSILQIAKMILAHKAYQYLPLSYEEVEVPQLLQEIQEEIQQMFANE